MSYPPHVTGHRTYRQVALDEYGILMCGSHVGCKRGYAMSAHRRGVVDNMGVIHDWHADVVPRRPGMRRFMLLVGWSKNDRQWEKLPRWERLYRANVWATKEARSRFHYQIPASQSFDDREKAAGYIRRSKVKLRTENFPAYLWMYRRLYTRTST